MRPQAQPDVPVPGARTVEGVQGQAPRRPAARDSGRRAAPRSRHHRRGTSAAARQLMRHGWVVYAKTPLAGPEVVLDYLSRYTHRVAVSNERIVGIDAQGVRLRVRADDHGGKRTVHIDGQTFIARFLQHVLPPGFKRIRHYGLLSPAVKHTGWPRRVRRWACRRSNPKPARMRRRSSSASRASRSRAAPLPPGTLAHGAVVAAAARRLDTADGSVQATPVSPVGYTTVHRPVRCRQPNGGVIAPGPATMPPARTSPHIDGSPGPFMRQSDLAQRAESPCQPLASATPAASEKYIAQQPLAPSHQRRFSPSTLICRGNARALRQRSAASDKRSPIVDIAR